jgi:SAM-dependent methyltransferase
MDNALCDCPSCQSKGLSIFYKVDDIPIHSVLNIPDREKALQFQTGNMALGFCNECGFISNTVFDPELMGYSPDCEESQAFSATFSTFARNMAKEIVQKYGLYDKDILEIGCGKGDFLALLCEQGNNRGIGFDPAYVEREYQLEREVEIRFITEYFSGKHFDYPADFICCRMTLEHIFETEKFVQLVRKYIGNRTDRIVFFQVPDITRALKACSFEDFYYEHCSYFSPISLSTLFEKCGFSIIDLKVEYNGQYITLVAKGSPDGPAQSISLSRESSLEALKGHITKYKECYPKVMEFWKNELKEIKKDQKRAVIWGSSSKGVSFLTTLNISDEIGYVVDINPYRQGNYMPGTGHMIVGPEFLKDYRPDIVIIMNAIYFDEISKNLSKMGLNPEILTLDKSM